MTFIYPEGYRYVDHIANHRDTIVVKAQSQTGDVVALKIQRNVGNLSRRFEREIKAMLEAAGPNTMPILDYDDTYAWYAMPLAEKSLAEEIPPVMQPQEALSILQTIADSLRPLHENGQVHRDLKPENILFLSIKNGERWVVADFGIVRNAPGLTTAPLTARGSLTGTDGWAAPEQYHDAHAATPASDVYSAGLLMGWLLTGKPPVPGRRYSSVGSLTSTILRATESEKHRRFATIDDFLDHFTEHILPPKAKLESLFENKLYAKIHGYLLESPDRLPSLSKRILKLDESQILEWTRQDLFGLVDTSVKICEALGEYFSAVGRDTVDAFLIWVLSVCNVLKRTNNLDELRILLTAQLSTTERLDQWTPRRTTLDWIDQLPRDVEDIARETLQSTNTWTYFAEEARLRWSSKRRTELIRDLADS